MAIWRAWPTSSSICREALTATLDLPMFLSAGTVSTAMMPMMLMTTNSSTSVNAVERRKTFTKNLLPGQNVVLVHADVGRHGGIIFFIRAGGPDHDLAVIK